MLSVTGNYMVKQMIYLFGFLFIEQIYPLLFDIIFSYREKFILYKNIKVVNFFFNVLNICNKHGSFEQRYC